MDDVDQVVQLIKEEKTRQRQTELLKQCLKEKWYHGSSTGLTHYCAFCRETCSDEYRPSKAIREYTNCRKCLCPPEICSNKTYGGFIATLVEKYGHSVIMNQVRVNMLSKEDLDTMIGLFEKYIKQNEED